MVNHNYPLTIPKMSSTFYGSGKRRENMVDESAIPPSEPDCRVVDDCIKSEVG
jgi:hypothetical protein